LLGVGVGVGVGVRNVPSERDDARAVTDPGVVVTASKR